MSTYLITGANRGIGLGFVAKYLSYPNATVIAAVRDPSHPSSKALSDLPKSSSSSLIIVKIDSASQSDPTTAIKHLQSEHNITSLDVVIANAAILKRAPPIIECTTEGLLDHTVVNVMGPVLLFQASLPLLLQSKNPKYVAMSSMAGTIGSMLGKSFPNAEYGPTKAMLNWMMRKIHVEHETIVSMPMNPGFVQTDMGNWGAKVFGMKEAEITTEMSVEAMVALIDGATRENASGRFLDYDGKEIAW